MALLGVGVYRILPDDEWIVWTGSASPRSSRRRRGASDPVGPAARDGSRPPITALVLSAAILVVEVGLTVIVLALTYAFRDFTF